MPKNATYPFLFDEEKSIDITSLKKLKYLEMNTKKRGTLVWKLGNTETGSISIYTSIDDITSFIILDYKCNDTNYRYKVTLITTNSNLGTGNIWYFICPFTEKRCRKLHLIDGRFMHRSALPSGMYSSQTQTKKWRQMEKVYGAYFDSEKHYKELYSKHFKTHYNGKPTKRYLKLLEKINETENFSIEEIEKLYLM